jgi:hypothetical protein
MLRVEESAEQETSVNAGGKQKTCALFRNDVTSMSTVQTIYGHSMSNRTSSGLGGEGEAEYIYAIQ